MENRITEQASANDKLQRMSVHDILTGINSEDARVHEAVAKTIPVMERLVEPVVERRERGGRMFYIGAGTSGRLGVTDASELPPTYGVPFDRVIGLIAGGDGALRRAVENAEDDTAGAWRDMAPYHPTADDVPARNEEDSSGGDADNPNSIQSRNMGSPSPNRKNSIARKAPNNFKGPMYNPNTTDWSKSG